MHFPVFTITSAINNLLNQISVAREKISSARILPGRESFIARSARIRMIHHSTSIEGNPLSEKDVENLLAGQTLDGVRFKDKQEILNYEATLRFIDKLSQKGTKKITEKIILKMHQLLMQKILPREKTGCYRRGPVAVVQNKTKKVMYQAPSAKKILRMMRELISWLNSQKSRELHPILVAGITHHQFVTIHPFSDGNGRAARSLATLVLYLRGYDIRKLFALEDYYNRQRQAYYQAIRTAQKSKNHDLTSWLFYFCSGVFWEMEKILEKIVPLEIDLKVKQKQQIYLSVRQRKILDFLIINRQIFTHDVTKITSISERTGQRELNKLINFGILQKKGKGKATVYYLSKQY